MEKNRRKQIIYQKTDLNHNLICQLPSIFKCSKCKKYNNIICNNIKAQLCLFCGNPNFVNKN